MKTFQWLLVVSLLPFITSAQPTTRTVKLVGILSYDTPVTILEVSKTNNRFQQGEQFTLRVEQSDNGIEIQSIDVTNGTVLAKVDGELRALAFDNSSGFKMADKPATIRLQDAKLHPLIYLYGDAKGRTVLEYPEVERTGFTFTANPHSKPEATKAFEELFASQQIAAIPDGEKFIMLVPYAFTNRVTPRSEQLNEPGPVMQQLSINFQGVPLPLVLNVYGEYVHHPIKNSQNTLRDPIYLVQQNSLSRGQICYAMETLFSWHDIRMLTNEDNTLSWEKIPPGDKVDPGMRDGSH